MTTTHPAPAAGVEDEIVETVARAIAKATALNEGAPEKHLEAVANKWWQNHEHQARAAIAAHLSALTKAGFAVVPRDTLVNAKVALEKLRSEMIASGNATARDYGWPLAAKLSADSIASLDRLLTPSPPTNSAED